jgi:hypothetical protein
MDEYTIGHQTYVSLQGSRTRVRGGGLGHGAWIARIVGSHPKFHFAREFCYKDRSGLSRSGRSGAIEFTMEGPGLYEYRDFCASSTRTESGFLVLGADGSIEKVSRQRAKALAEAMTAETMASDARAAGAPATVAVDDAPDSTR